VSDGASTDRRAVFVQGPPMSLSQAQLADLVRQLEERHTALLEDVRAALESSENLQYIELLDRAPADIGDQSVADALADINLAIVDRHVKELRDIEAAQARVTDRTYGVCVDCGDGIALARLRAWPTAKRCHACQQQRERTFSHEGTPRL
jgi:RNA polymerase-binding protein DksA